MRVTDRDSIRSGPEREVVKSYLRDPNAQLTMMESPTQFSNSKREQTLSKHFLRLFILRHMTAVQNQGGKHQGRTLVKEEMAREYALNRTSIH